MKKRKKKYGFISPDDGSNDIVVLPVSCEEWNYKLPPIGTHISYMIVTDKKTGKPRAEDVKSIDGNASSSRAEPTQANPSRLAAEPSHRPKILSRQIREPRKPKGGRGAGKSSTGTMKADKTK